MKQVLKSLHRWQATRSFNFFCYLWVGGLSALAFAPYGWTHLVWLAPFGLFWLEQKYRNSYKQLFIQGLWVSVVFSSLSFYWLVYMFSTFGGLPYWLAIIIFILYAMAFNIKFNLYLLLHAFLSRQLGRHTLLISGFSVLVSELFTYQVFPWNWGNLLAGNEVFAQNAEYFSVYGLSFVVFIVSFAFFQLPAFIHFYYRRKQLSGKMVGQLVLPVLLIVFFWGNGYRLQQKWQQVKPQKKVNVMMIQPDAPLEFRDKRKSFREIMQDLMNRIEKLAIQGSRQMKPDLIVLPESSVPFFSTHNSEATRKYNPSYWNRFEALAFLLANRFQANIFLNEIDSFFKQGIRDRNHQRMQNSSVLFDPNGRRQDSYAKSYLLVFGEYIPFGEEFEFLYRIIPQIGRFLPGNKQNLIRYFSKREKKETISSHISWRQTATISLPDLRKFYRANHSTLEQQGRFLPLICYEVILPEFVRKFRKAGNPDFIVNITNDKWYGNTVESFQHLELARIRSIEYRKWMVRSTNSGTSAFVDHLGRIVNGKFTKILASTVYSEAIAVIPTEMTFYLQYGNYPIYLFLLVLGLGYIYFIYQQRNRRNR